MTFTNEYLNRFGADVFGLAFDVARLADPNVAAGTSDFLDRPGTDYFLTADGASGFAVRNDGELVFVFSTVAGRGDMLVKAARDRGATRLDCFDGYLVRLYGRNGFVEVDRVANWTAGQPDVVFMDVCDGTCEGDDCQRGYADNSHRHHRP